jgi:asparagine synthase (glutamine-hydrolysing)
MCGIAGATGSDRIDLTRRMTAALQHRGPDDEQYFSDGRVAFGFRRLSIIDLAGGRQPIENETGEIVLICNGEIYNSPELRGTLERSGHRFRTASDVEVILHLYEERGARCVEELRGMFAFAMWDAPKQILLLGRDHMGQKPLFYYQDDRRFAFASEIQALLAAGVVQHRLDANALWHYLSLRFMPDHYSLIKDVRKLPAATTLTLQNGKTDIRRYWEPVFTNKMRTTEAEATEALDENLREAVRLHLLSDVPVGSFLSGGIDSTTIATMMARQSSSSIPVFSIGVDESDYDELPMAQAVADSNAMTFHARRVKPDIAELLPTMVHHLGEPADPYGVGVYLVSRLAAGHVKVVLCGDGGDESFGGYDRYLGQSLVDLYCAVPAVLRRTVLAAIIARIPESFRYKSLAQRLRWLQAMSGFSGAERYARALGFLRFMPEEKEKLFTPQAMNALPDADSIARVLTFFEADNATELTDRMLYTDLMTRVSDHNLVMSDRMSMACSLEVRSPFVDPRVIEFAASLPVDLKIKGRRLKYLLRKVAAGYVPDEIVQLPKQGFGFPLGRWMQRDLRKLVVNRLKQSRFVEAGVFREDYLLTILREHLDGKRDHSYRLWLLLGLEIWFDVYLERQPVEAVISQTREWMTA